MGPGAAFWMLAYFASSLGAETAGSPDGRFLWDEGAAHLSFVSDPGRPGASAERIKLPPPDAEGAKRTVVFPDRGEYFCVMDELPSEIGLHLGGRRGSEKAKAVVVASVLRLVDKRGRVRWSRRMREMHMVGARTEAKAPRLGEDGTLAVLLQDSDPLAKTRPVLIVIDRKGVERLRLDYASWTRIDAFSLSAGGRALAVRGVGLIPDGETWGPALGYYRTDSEARWVRPLSRGERTPSLAFVHSEPDPASLRKNWEKPR